MAKRALPSLNALRALEAFARHGRMTLAADELCVTHGAVSRHIRQLEEQLGVALVEGPRNRPRLTLAAAQLTTSLTYAFDTIERAVPRRSTLQAALRVSCIGTFAMKWLIPRLPRFYALHPGIDVSISESTELPDFGVCDLAIRIENAPFPAQMASTPFLANQVGLVVAPQLIQETSTIDELLSLPRLQTKTRLQAWQEWSQLTGVSLPRASAVHVFEHNSYMVEAAMAGLGVAIATWSVVMAEVTSGRLAAPSGFVAKSGDHVALRPPGDADPRAAAFEEWLISEGALMPDPPPWGRRQQTAER